MQWVFGLLGSQSGQNVLLKTKLEWAETVLSFSLLPFVTYAMGLPYHKKAGKKMNFHHIEKLDKKAFFVLVLQAFGKLMAKKVISRQLMKKMKNSK